MQHGAGETPRGEHLQGILTLRVLLAEAEPAALVKLGLEASGCEVVAVSPDVTDLTRRFRAHQALRAGLEQAQAALA